MHETQYIIVKRPDADIILALLGAAIDDLGHTDNMSERINAELGFGYGVREFVDYHDMIDAAQRLIERIKAGDVTF